MDSTSSTRIPPLSLEIRQQDDGDGPLRVTLLGEIDMATAEYLAAQIARLAHARRPVRLDLSRLRFIDCAGLDALVRAVTAARDSGLKLEVEPRVSRGVERIFRLAGEAPLLWGPDRGARAALRVIQSDRQNQAGAGSPRRAHG